MKISMTGLAVLLCAALLAACSSAADSQPTPTPAGAAIQVTSTAFNQGAAIPAKYTCSGEEISPPLAWSGIPQGTKSLAIIADDPDAPAGTWVHWVVYNLPPDLTGLPEGASHPQVQPVNPLTAQMQGKNSWGRADYGGPCPPSGEHRYFFKVYALDAMLDIQSPDKDALLKAMQGHIVGQGELMGVYKK